MAVSSEFKRSDTLPRPQYFTTRIIGGEDLPDYDFITLPADASFQSYKEEDMRRWTEISDSDTPALYSIFSNPDHFFELFVQMIVKSARPLSEDSTTLPSSSRIDLASYGVSLSFYQSLSELAHDIYLSQPLPIMQSPLAGKTIAELAKGAGQGAIFYQIFPHPGLGDLVVFFVLLGGIRIVFGASEGIATALSHGLNYRLLKWMGVPVKTTSPRKKRDE
jgi:hypothetical protein